MLGMQAFRHADDTGVTTCGMPEERDAGKAFDDLLPFLLSRFNAEQEQGRSHILNELLVNKKFPDYLWEDLSGESQPGKRHGEK